MSYLVNVVTLWLIFLKPSHVYGIYAHNEYLQIEMNATIDRIDEKVGHLVEALADRYRLNVTQLQVAAILIVEQLAMSKQMHFVSESEQIEIEKDSIFCAKIIYTITL